MTNLDAIRAAALAWHDAGFCVLPTAADGSKRPGVGSWTHYQSEQYPRTNLEATTVPGIGLVCGAVSGGLEMLELEGRAVAEGALALLDDLIPAAGLTGLWLRLTAEPGAYIERTPSGGLHILYRVTDGAVPGNTALARRPATPDEQAEDPHQRAKVLAETRGEKGYVVVAPSHGPTHPSGKPWEVTIGQAGQVPTITAAEREQLHRVFRCLDRMPEPERQIDAPRVPRPRVDGSTSPGDAFAAQADWSEVLEPHGWTEMHRPGGGETRYWVRPGKTVGISATTNARGTDRFHNFSTSAHPFDAEQSYSKFGAYALLNHGGDHSAAARELARQGYGTSTSNYAAGQQRAAIAELTGGRDRSTTMDATNGAGRAWEDPLPLGWHVKAPAFPAGVLPPVVGRYVVALAEATQTPADLGGTVVLGVLAASVGGRLMVQCPTWVEPTNLFPVPVLPPASRKSAVVSACRGPLVEAEQRLRDDIGDQVHDTQTAWEVLNKRAEAAKGLAAKTGELGDMADAQEAVRSAEEARQRIVVWPRLCTVDATPEALVGLLAEHGGRIAAVSAEAGVFASLTGRYSKSPNLDPVLMAHAGDAITVDRRSRAPEHIEHPALTIVASIQPYALREMVDRDDFAGRGLLARVLWSLPVDNAGYRKIRDVSPVPEAVDAAYRTLVVDLATWAGSRKDAVMLKLDDDATEVLLSYAEHVEKLLRPNGALGEYRLTREWGGKLVGAVARIAGCLHAAEGIPALGEPITEATMRAAVTLGEYYRAHAVLALSPGDDKRAEAARTLLDWLAEKGKTTFTVRELCRTGPRSMRKADLLDRPLSYLADLGWVRKRDDSSGYDLHPDAARFLNPGDNGDNGDTNGDTAGQSAYEAPAHPVATPGDTRRHPATGHGEVSHVVATGGDTPGDSTAHGLAWENPGAVAAVAAVAAPTAAPTKCPRCAGPTWLATGQCRRGCL